MTDKEKAEEHALLYCVRNCSGNTCTTRKTCERYKARYSSFLSGLDEGKSESKKEIAELKGKVKGFEAGRLKWHDLRKDPSDLPKDKSNVLMFCGYYTFGFYETDEKVWLEFEYSNVYKDAENVIAWTEIPIFEEQV